MTSMKNVISWNTMSKIGVRFGSALEPCDIEADIFDYSNDSVAEFVRILASEL